MAPPSLSSESAASTDRERLSRPVPLAACEACRKQKMRCIRPPESSSQQPQPCDRCRRNNRPCHIPERRPQGRRPGAVGRYSGVEKAVRQIQTQVRKASRLSSKQQEPQIGAGSSGPCPTDHDVLEILLNFGASPKSPQHRDRHQSITVETIAGSPPSHASPPSHELVLSRSEYDTLQPPPVAEISPRRTDDSVSNPLGLLGDASGEAQDSEDKAESNLQIDPSLFTLSDQHSHHRPLTSDANAPSSLDQAATTSSSFISPNTIASNHPPTEHTARNLLSRPGYVSLGLKLDRDVLESALDNLLTRPGRIGRYANYFRRKEQNQSPDTGPDVDPVDLGLISMEEVWYLFPIFFERLHPINGILDPMLHTPDFVRPRSALLFTWILAITAQFDHSSGPLAKRLRLHGEKLSKHVHSCGYKSVEIAQGYYISLLAAVPANTLAEEHAWIFTNYLLGMISDLGLDNPSSPSDSTRSAGHPESDLALQQEELLRNPCEARLVRNRERTWFRIVLWERAHSAARGKVTPFPENDLTRRVQDWWRHPLADPTDRYTSGFVILRRNLAMLYQKVKERFGRPDNARHWVRDLVDSTLDPWRREWITEAPAATTSADHMRNLFLHYVYMHGRLWTLSFALHDPSNNAQDSDATKDDCFEAAVNCCEVTIRDLREIGEPMYCLMAPTWAMSSYAAVLALKLFPQLYGDRPGQQVELLAMLAEVALQLERAGTTPSHRFGVAALLGQHLFIVLRKQLRVLKNEAAVTGVDAPAAPGQSVTEFGNFLANSSSGGGDNLAGPPNGTVGFHDGQQVTELSTGYSDPFLFDGLSPGGAGALQDAFTDMMREWGGPPFDFDGVYY